MNNLVGAHDKKEQRIEAFQYLSIPFWKRSIDMVVALVGLILFAPVFLVAAFAVKLCSPGPAFFIQQRAGLGGKPFWIYKFRTMIVDAERQQQELRELSEQDGPAFKMGKDPRVTIVGHWLRRLCIDELPQLLNVFRGEMSLVGPRPLPVEESNQMERWQRQRLCVTPGMTCYWQVKNRSTPIPFDEWMRLDLQYVHDRSFRTDLIILLKTALFVVGFQGR